MADSNIFNDGNKGVASIPAWQDSTEAITQSSETAFSVDAEPNRIITVLAIGSSCQVGMSDADATTAPTTNLIVIPPGIPYSWNNFVDKPRKFWILGGEAGGQANVVKW